MNLKRIFAGILAAALLCTVCVTASAHHGKGHHGQSACHNVTVSQESPSAPADNSASGNYVNCNGNSHFQNCPYQDGTCPRQEECNANCQGNCDFQNCQFCGAACSRWEENCANCGASRSEACFSVLTGVETRAAWHNKAFHHSELYITGGSHAKRTGSNCRH